jgi:hypothetical protein
VQGEALRADHVVFADTGGEIPETYGYMERFVRPFCRRHGLPFHIVRAGGHYGPSLYDYYWRYRVIPQPWSRSCTHRFKIRPIYRFLREHGASAKEPTEIQVGISADEAHRRRDTGRLYARNVYPLCHLELGRADCARVIQEAGWPVPPRSACYFCPFQKLSRWRETQNRHPELIEKAVALEDRARKRADFYITGRKPLRALLQGEQRELPGLQGTCGLGYCFV